MVLWFEVLWTAFFAVLAWGTLLLLLGLSFLVPIHWGWLRMAMLGLWAAHLGPLTLLWEMVKGIVGLGAGFWLLSWFIDQCYERLFASKTRRQIQVFNLLILACIPLCLWMLIPVLGWILGVVETVLIAYWVLRAVYKEDPFKTGAAMVLSAVCVGVVNFVVVIALGLLLRALPSPPHWDPTEAWTQALVARALPDDSGLSDFAAALNKAAMATGQPAQSMAVPSPVATAIPAVEPTPVPEAAPKAKASHRHAAKTAVPAAPVPTLVPTAQPTAGSRAGQGIKDAAASVDKEAAAKQLLHLFGH